MSHFGVFKIIKDKLRGRHTRTNWCTYTWLTTINYNYFFCYKKLHLTEKRHNVGISIVYHQSNDFSKPYSGESQDITELELKIKCLFKI